MYPVFMVFFWPAPLLGLYPEVKVWPAQGANLHISGLSQAQMALAKGVNLLFFWFAWVFLGS